MSDLLPDPSDEMYQSPWSNRVHFVVHPLLQMSSAADVLPHILYSVSINGKLAAMALALGYVALLICMTPMWLLSKLLTEAGVYALMLGTVIFLGRGLVRLLVFPGSSHKVYGEIETEFCRYSVRMLQTACSTFMDLGSTLLMLKNTEVSESSSNLGSAVLRRDVAALWKRACAYRNRVVKVYAEVLQFLLGDSRSGTLSPYGDIGNLEGVSLQAQADGKVLLVLLQRVLKHMNKLEEEIPSLTTNSTKSISNEARVTARALVDDTTELRDIVTSFKPQGSPDDEEESDYGSEAGDQERDGSASLRDQLQRQGGSSVDAVKSLLSSVGSMLDPPPHSSVFGFDVLRGCVLSRYQGAQQFWVHRPNGGMIDVLYIPSVSAASDGGARTRRKAVLYCNPNAGLVEVAAGMSLAGGNVDPDEAGGPDAGWTDFYIENGYDMYLFNYAGFGRSFGSNFCSVPNVSPNVPGVFARVNRIIRSCFLGFKPTPDTLRQDAATVGKHIINEIGVESLVVHGESIGGLAASGAARELSNTSTTRDGFSLLVCDRTFCNLEGVAQRLIGKWTSTAIRMLVPFWNTDVAGDFLAVDGPKVLAIDAGDAMIADASSLKAGIAFAKEITNERQTKDICWMTDAPLDYRMADWENVGVIESKFVQATGMQVRAPMWPADKQIALREALHFASCARRIGKVATSDKNGQPCSPRTEQPQEEGIEVTSLILEVDEDTSSAGTATNQPVGNNQELQHAWKALACCDGLCGAPLGLAVKEGSDCTVSWLCSTLTFGGQVVVQAAEERASRNGVAQERNKEQLSVVTSDFDCRPAGYEKDETGLMVHPIPIPTVVDTLKEVLNSRSLLIRKVDHELRYCLKTLEYVVARLSSPQAVEESRRNLHLNGASCSFLNLHCGHNNQYSVEEKQELSALLQKVDSSTR